ncbi:MAG: hypothetical protein Q4C04_06610 [Clostridia bacterium]|nr:hypothetical protein [Clostridia bacterium]
MEVAARSNSRNNGKKIRNAKGIKLLACGVSLCVLIIAGVCIGIFFSSRAYGTTISLEEYTSIGRDGNGEPRGILDIEAIISDLKLPSPRSERVQLSRYPDVEALCEMQMALSYTEARDVMRVDISCDVETLERYGIIIETLSWEQQIKGAAADEQVVTPPVEDIDVTPGLIEEVPVTPAMDTGYLTSLLDNNNNGLNLRKVCERVHSERDYVCSNYFGNNYSTVKTQVCFIVDTSGRSFRNLYRASYRAYERTEGVLGPRTVYFTVDIYDLYWNPVGGVSFGRTDVTIHSSDEEALSLAEFQGDGYQRTRLYDGGVVVSDKSAFDQNGFVRFYGYPTSYMMANGIMWSPTYDELTEDMIWSLTAVSGHSLANILRYARKEISARYYVPFSEATDSEFYGHFNQYDWYEGLEDNWEDRMTETERQNMSLLREIQSLVEN